MRFGTRNGAADGRRRRVGAWRRVLAVIAVIVVAFCAVTARLFVWPAQGMPARVSAIVMLAGPGDRLPVALDLARQHRAPVLVVSRGNQGYGGPCPSPVPGVKLICFEPDPATTQGEAKALGRMATAVPLALGGPGDHQDPGHTGPDHHGALLRRLNLRGHRATAAEQLAV